MPWLFVDYDQGAGGESFCSLLSQSAQCENLTVEKFANGRTKVCDKFNQEWLKFIPKPQKIEPHDTLYSIVPIHNFIKQAEEFCGKIYSIRIINPTDPVYIKKLKDDQIKKVYLTTEPTPQYFYGLINCYLPICKNPERLKKLKYKTPTIDLLLTVRDLEINEFNRQQLLEEIQSTITPEPNYEYTLKIKYEDLISNSDKVYKDLEKVFGIIINV